MTSPAFDLGALVARLTAPTGPFPLQDEFVGDQVYKWCVHFGWRVGGVPCVVSRLLRHSDRVVNRRPVTPRPFPSQLGPTGCALTDALNGTSSLPLVSTSPCCLCAASKPPCP
jgi:hypothetical protein